jgi:hypothetical protein
METKLTLRLRKSVIDRAKDYAQQHHISLSKLIESYLENVTVSKPLDTELELPPLVKSLSGVIKMDESSSEFKKDYGDYLEKKYK